MVFLRKWRNSENREHKGSIKMIKKGLKMRKIELTDNNGIYTIEVDDSFESIEDYIDFLVRPVLLAAGFSEKLVAELGESL